MGIISFGEFDKKYLYIFLSYALAMTFLLFIFLLAYSLSNSEINYNNYDNYNILLNMLLTYFGQIFFFIPELILKNSVFKKRNSSSNISSKRESKPHIIIYIFNDYSEKLTYKDIILIGSASLLLLVVDYFKLFIQIKNGEEAEELIFNEQYNFVELFFLFILSYLIYKIRFYKHQYCSIFSILILGIFRYIIKIIYFYNSSIKFPEFLYDIILLIIIALCEAFIFVYQKGLMEYKYFSPYKICYIFGSINTIITLIILIISSYIKCGPNFFCSLKYDENYYFDNIFQIIKNYNYKQLIVLFFGSIIYGFLKLLINITMNKFTVCHIFLLLQNKELTSCVFEEIRKRSGIIILAVILVNHILEFFVILVFLEIIELKFCGLDKNLKKNIKDRADDETRLSLKTEDNIDDNFTEKDDISDYNNK